MRPDLALVTGTSRGIGRAVVDALLARGFEVVGIARAAPELPAGAAYRHVTCDLGDVDALGPALERALLAAAAFDGRARVGLVNNAARLDVGPVARTEPAALARTMVVNVVAPVVLHGFVLRHAPAKARLRIVDLSSGAATRPYAGWVGYCASKAALDMAGRVLAAEVDEMPSLAGRDVALVSYAPHVVATAMQATLRAAPVDDFPSRSRFVRLFEDGDLVDPAGPAAEIAELLRDDTLPRVSQRRFTPPAES